MPIYTYECNMCGHQKEIFASSAKTRPKVVKCDNDKCIYYMYFIMSACNFKINGYNEKNGYTKEV